MALTGQPPWHLWGTSEVVDLPVVGGGLPAPVTGEQLARVNYKRPETWAFFLFARLVGSTPTVATNPIIVTVNIDVSFGIGRSVFQTEGNIPVGSDLASASSFQQFRFQIGTGSPITGAKYATVGRTPVLDDVAGGAGGVVEKLVFESCQCSFRAIASGVGAQRVQVRVGAFFAPLNHVRPDWFTIGSAMRAFLGGETGGT